MSLQNLKDVLADLIPKEQTRIKNFKQQYGKTNIGQITVDMVSNFSDVGQNYNILRNHNKTNHRPVRNAAFFTSTVLI